MSYCRLSDADIYLYEDNEGVVCFGKNGHQAYGMTKKEAIEHVREHRRQGDYVPDYVDTILQSEYIAELELQLAARDALIERLIEAGENLTTFGSLVEAGEHQAAYDILGKWIDATTEYRASKDGGGM